MKYLKFTTLLIIAVLLVACGQAQNQSEESDKKVTIGFGPGTYEEIFREGVLPILEEKGYDVEVKTFSQTDQINPAMKDGDIQASVFQSTAYMNSINDKIDAKMIKNNDVPTAPQSLWSKKHKTLNDIKDGQTIAVPNDPVNQERAFKILEQLGWVKLDNKTTGVNFKMTSVHPDKYDLKFEEVAAPQILRSLEDVDYGIVNGNYIADSGQKISDALVVEDTPDEHKVMLSINEADKNKPWAKALRDAYNDPQFQKWFREHKEYSGYIEPKNW
ncbi:MetQ/NlpA family ABC transporter substrate-binding protein [Staphylococcus sp. 17KM0847]|uniref:MetQ/NlpA family ABC transporter substrate-binding protein n=1 Tax=Staphylococcus sp. 17KM0847 TaxID=2583989 RepID=UPI0015DD3ED1|nr:MetQ/NlpA family ABC transporter substrate-binding protein [Staphylococcus sp. 17KM0847]QLK86904.1 methionine ABC transporter substrate-binding protein [Staphylococcus sp. 17KM0847]